jgi:glutathione S-transferase
MSEQFSGEKGPAPENLEDRKHRELQEAMDEEDRIMREIDNVLANTPDRADAEKIVLEKWAPLMDEAMKKSGEALKAWLDTMREAGERERKEIDDMEKDLGKE